MTNRIPSADETQAYTALAIDVYSGSFFGRNAQRCVLECPENAYFNAAVEMIFDMTKLDFWQMAPVAGKKSPYTVLSAAINSNEFFDANKMLDELIRRNVTPQQLLDALDLHHSQGTLQKILQTKYPYPSTKSKRDAAKKFMAKLHAFLPRYEYITQIEGRAYPHDMAKEDLEYEQDKALRNPKPSPSSYEGTISPIKHITSAPLSMIQGTFTHLLFRDR